MTFANGFWSGIDIFFVLSGFLIGRQLIQDLYSKDRLYYSAFFIRRSFRIFPAYYFILLVSLFFIAPWQIPAMNFLYQTSDWQELFRTSWSNFLYVVNYHRPGHQASIMSWAWSLCVEEHFYLLLPLVLWLLFKVRSARSRIVIIIGCVLIPFLGRGIQYALNPDIKLLEGFYYFSHNRFDEPFVGVVIAYFYVVYRDQLQRFCERYGGWLGVAGLTGTASVWIYGGLMKDTMFTIVFQFFIMAASSGLLLLNVLFKENLITRFFRQRWWYPLARISYGTYLIHPFVLFLLVQLYSDYFHHMHFTAAWLIIFYFAVMIITSFLAVIMFIMLEGPMLKLGSRWAKERRAAAMASNQQNSVSN